MFRTCTFLCAVVLTSGGLMGMAAPAHAQHHHHGGHGHAYHHHHHGRYHYGHYHGYSPYGYYSYGYPSYGYSTYAYSGYVYPIYPYTAGSPYAASQVAAAPVSSTVRVQVLLPDPDAQVWVDGTETSSRGMTRYFESPPLDRAKHTPIPYAPRGPREGGSSPKIAGSTSPLARQARPILPGRQRPRKSRHPSERRSGAGHDKTHST